MDLRAKLTGYGIGAAAAPIALVAITLLSQGRELSRAVSEGCDRLAKADLGHVADSVYSMCASHQDYIEVYQRVARAALERHGSLAADAAPPIVWQAKNQFTAEVSPAVLPLVRVGNTVLEPVRDPGRAVPIVDEVRTAVQATATVFQRMNEAGAMLRVATSVIGADGQRAIGTYIPPVNPGGEPNPVVAAVMRKKGYRGLAWVVNDWYITAYDPLLDQSGRVVGMMYVGIPESTQSRYVKDFASRVRTGSTGYVFALHSGGTVRGSFIFSQNPKERGKNWDARTFRS